MKKYDEWEFFRTPSGQKSYHKQCIRCMRKCKQSWQVTLLDCPKYRRAGAPRKP